MTLTKEERLATLEAWGVCAGIIAFGGLDVNTMPDDLKDDIREFLKDIKFRDALISYIARCQDSPEEFEANRAMLAKVAEGGDIPSSTILAAMHYLSGNYDTAKVDISAVLEREEYSLARLVRTGLEMGAPAETLSRSFSHYSPAFLCE